MLSISTTKDENTTVMKLVGRLDVKAAKDADAAFTEAAEASTDIVLDLQELDYIASAGLRALKRLRSAVRSNKGTLTVVNVQDNVMEILEMTGFAAMLNFG
jgi:anti-sigma B factor antagonist